MLFTVRKLLRKIPEDILSHSKRVAVLGYILSKKIGLTAEECKNIFLGGLLHDIGKCSIPSSILYKKGKLTEDEFDQIKLHCTYGVKIIQRINGMYPILPIIHYHHERWDGLGYFGLRNFEIPLSARIISITDAFDAMTYYRPYQVTRKKEDALMEIIKCASTQFDPYLVKNFNYLYPIFMNNLEDYIKYIEVEVSSFT